jgi:hypothetical protein
VVVAEVELGHHQLLDGNFCSNCLNALLGFDTFLRSPRDEPAGCLRYQSCLPRYLMFSGGGQRGGSTTPTLLTPLQAR